MRKLLYVYFFLILLPWEVAAKDDKRAKKIKILPVPTFGYTPETKTSVGAVALFTFNIYNDTLTRISNAKIEASYTWQHQAILECEWAYFLREEKWFLKGLFHISKYPDFYYGIGASTSENNKYLYNSNRLNADMHFLKKTGIKFFMVPNIRYLKYSHVLPPSSLYPELKDRVTGGIGYTLQKDTRNNLLSPAAGLLLYTNMNYNFSEKNYLRLTLDARYYKTWNEKFTLALRNLNIFTSEQPPFFDYALLGGDKFVRGYYYGRYRDMNMNTLQAETRFALIWRFDMAVFGGASGIYGSKENLSFKSIKYNCGAGLRFLIDKKDRTNLRIDYAFPDKGFYIAFGESF